MRPRRRCFYVACVMARGLAEMDWDDMTETVPAVSPP
jgi:AGZA family xanthine/uracil permease-like MFS transporter